MFRLDGKTALITGAGRGVGLGIARALAGQGARVIVNDIDGARAEAAAAQLRGEGFDAIGAAFDVTAVAAVEAAVAGLGRIDILVNNAGNAGDAPMQQMAFREMSPADWDRFIAINLKGVLNCTHAVLPGMCERGWGRVITISSEAGRMGLNIGVSLYGAAKAGAAHFMRHLSQEVSRQGVTANAISVGLMNNVPPEFTDRAIAGIPVGRLGTPADIGAGVVYLASEEASWVTGATLAINGGNNPT